MIPPRMEMDMTDFNAAVTEYANVTQKTLATATNRQFVNLSIHAIKDAKKAQAAEIRAVTKLALSQMRSWLGGQQRIS